MGLVSNNLRSKVKNLETTVNSIPLDQTKVEGQRNFLEFHQLHKYEGGEMQYSIKGNRYFDFMIPVDGIDKLNVVFQKDTNDDFIKMRNFGIWGNTEGLANVTYGSVTGPVMNTGSSVNHYATTVGTTLTKSFVGTEISLYHYYDTRGGVWRVEIDGVFVKNVSTHINVVTPAEVYNESAQIAKRLLAKDLTNATHEIKLIFQGDDASNPPTNAGAPTPSRGWIRNQNTDADASPLSYAVKTITFVEKSQLLHNSSNKEFAFNVKQPNTAQAGQWFPEHNNRGTVFLGSTGYQRLIIDGVEITSYAAKPYTNFKSATLIQVLEGIHPEVVAPLTKITMVTTINRDGVHIDTTFDFLQDTQIAAGYINMLPAEGTFARHLTSGMNSRFEATKADESIDQMNEGDRSFSYVFTGDETNVNYYAGMIHRNATETLRLGLQGRLNDDNKLGATWLQHRSTGLQKLYPQVFTSNHIVTAGSTYRFAGSFFAGKLPNARKLITGL